jgi:hypothetical protein
MEDSFELRILDPQEVRLFQAGGVLRMTLGDQRSYLRVRVARAFPLSDPHHYYGLLDGAGKDIGVIVNPADLDTESRTLAEDALEKHYFVPVVKEVLSVKEDYGSIVWEVDTDRGRKTYIVRSMRDNLADLSATRVLITDVDGNRFEIPDITRLGAYAQSLVLRNT